jgi:hypothetical protein
MPAIAPYVSAISVMLAAYGFFYNAWKGRIEAGQDVGVPVPGAAAKATQRRTIEAARRVARVLGWVAILVWLIFLKKVADEVCDAFDAHWDLGKYSTLDVAFVVLANSWLLIGVALLNQAWSLTKKRRKYV